MVYHKRSQIKWFSCVSKLLEDGVPQKKQNKMVANLSQLLENGAKKKKKATLLIFNSK